MKLHDFQTFTKSKSRKEQTQIETIVNRIQNVKVKLMKMSNIGQLNITTDDDETIFNKFSLLFLFPHSLRTSYENIILLLMLFFYTGEKLSLIIKIIYVLGIC
jgi:hypothetical protein